MLRNTLKRSSDYRYIEFRESNDIRVMLLLKAGEPLLCSVCYFGILVNQKVENY